MDQSECSLQHQQGTSGHPTLQCITLLFYDYRKNQGVLGWGPGQLEWGDGVSKVIGEFCIYQKTKRH